MNYISKNELDKACFAHDGEYADSKDLAWESVADKVFKVKAYEIALNLKYDECHRGLKCMVYKFFDKKKTPGVNVNDVLTQ